MRTSRVYLRNSGLVHALLDLEHWDAVLGHPVAGPSWEGFVIDNLVVVAGERRSSPDFYRTESGAEVDVLFERAGAVEMAIEITRSTAPAIGKGFRLACDTLRPQATYVVHGGDDRWPLKEGVTGGTAGIDETPGEGVSTFRRSRRGTNPRTSGHPRGREWTVRHQSMR